MLALKLIGIKTHNLLITFKFTWDLIKIKIKDNLINFKYTRDIRRTYKKEDWIIK